MLPVLAACGTASGSGSQGNASCVRPYLNNEPPNRGYRSAPTTVRPGGTLTIYGHWYTSTCNDTGNRSRLDALPPVHLTLTLPGGRVDHMGEFKPSGPDMGFVASVRIPAATPAGTAVISDDQAPFPATYRFMVGPA